MQINITPEAERDIVAITLNIKQQDSIAAAIHAVSEFRTQFNKLALFPDTGRVGGSDGTREVVITGLPYITIYETSDTSVTIVRVLYGADERRLDKRK